MSSSKQPSRFEAILLPAIVLQSAIMGGGYSTGREVAQYAGRFGPAGWTAVVLILVGFCVLSVLAFEVARTAQVYDYKKWIRELIGPAWPLFDLLAVTMMLLVIAVMSAAMGSMLQQTLGFPYWAGLAIAFVVIAFLAWRGTAVMERFKVIGTVVLYFGYVGFSLLVLNAPIADPAGLALPAAEPLPAPVSSFGLGAVVLSGLLYVGYNLAVYPSVLFCLHRQRTRRDTLISGVVSGLLMTIPFVLTFLCLLKFYPNPSVLDDEIPWLEMMQAASDSQAWVVVFGVVAGWTLLETAIVSIHALVDRIDKNLEDLPAFLRPEHALSPTQKVGLSLAILALATLLARFGIIALVSKGYGYLAYGFILLLALPLITVGLYKVARHRA